MNVKPIAVLIWTEMNVLETFLLLLVSVGVGSVPWFSGWTKASGSSIGKPAPAFDFDCDNDTSLQPCRCYNYGYLVCPELDNELELLKPLAVTLARFPDLNYFQLEDSILRFLPAEIFKGQKFLLINILRSTLTALTDSDLAFVGLEHELQFLRFRDVVIQSDWDWSIFRKLHLVKSLVVDGWSIDALDKVPDDNLMPIEELLFLNNEIAELHPEVFQKFQNLSSLQLRYSQIKLIQRTMFPIPASKLETLDMGYNEIETLPDDIFRDMPVLKSIILENNQLLTLNGKAFKPVLNKVNFITVNAYKNDIECDCRLLWIVDIYKNYKFFSGSCTTPLRLKGKFIMLLSSDELYC